jgi:hypothetical protein
MSRLHLRCGLCGRTQADGLLSRAAWGHLKRPGGAVLRACPTCRNSSPDWENRLLNGSGAQDPPRLGS